MALLGVAQQGVAWTVRSSATGQLPQLPAVWAEQSLAAFFVVGANGPLLTSPPAN